MFDEEAVLIIDSNGVDVTKKVIDYEDDIVYVDFGNGKIYTYNKSSLTLFRNPVLISEVVVKTNFGILNNIAKILKFDSYYNIFFNNGTNKVYSERDLFIENNLLKNPRVMELFNYFSEMASNLTIEDLNNTNEGSFGNLKERFLEKVYSNIRFVSDSSVISNYCFDVENSVKNDCDTFIYPFSFNLSQQDALKKVFSNKISVIEGPPGTGKTQTILNIIVNATMRNKTVAVVSNNNTATKNVCDKLEKQGLSFLCATLGKRDNVNAFLKSQSDFKKYPSNWALDETQVNDIYEKLKNMNFIINKYLYQRNNLASISQELEDLKLEREYFLKSKNDSELKKITFPFMDASQLHEFFLYLNKQNNKSEFFNLRVQLLSMLKFKFLDIDLYKNTIKDILESLEDEVYLKLILKLEDEKKNIEDDMINLNLESEFEEYTRLSMLLFRNIIVRNYNNKEVYDKITFMNTQRLVKDYPIVMSTTYSLSKCVMDGFMFDYVIIDESSQVDIVSAFPTLRLARNAVVVGDSKQLPNIVNSEKISLFNSIFNKYDLNEKYNYTSSSLLDLTKNINSNIPITLLKEHYRCHPKIIDFCNKKFYNDELIILSKANNDAPMKQYKCVKGNFHMVKDKSSYNKRQAEVIFDEVFLKEKIDFSNGSIGVITPYRAQKQYIYT